MKAITSIRSLAVLAAGACAVASALGAAAPAKSDIATKDKRHAAIELANSLLKPVDVPRVSADLKSPFNPPGFDAADPDAPKPAGAPATSSAAGPAKPSSARDILNLAAPFVIGKGAIEMGGELYLAIGSRIFKTGSTIAVTIDNVPYALEISAITNTSYTLRYRGEEITRSINKSGK